MASKPLFLGRLIAIGGNEDKAGKLVVLKRVVQEVGYGKTFDTSQKGICLVVFRYQVESAGLKAAKEAYPYSKP